MSTGTPDPSGWKRFFGPTVRMMLLIWAIVIVGAYLLYNFTGQKTSGQRATDQQPPKRDVVTIQDILPAPLAPNKPMVIPSAPRPKEEPQDAAPTPPVAPPSPKPEEVAAAKIRWVDIKGQIEEIQESLDPAVGDAETWITLTKQLPGNEAGKRIAGSKSHVDQYRALLEQPRQPARVVRQYLDTVKVHLETAQRYLGQTDNTTIPGSELTQELDRLKGEAKTLKREYHRDRLALEKLVSDTAKMAPAEMTLEQAIEQREKEVAGEYLTQLTATRTAAEAKAQEKLREADEKAIKEKADAEAERRVQLGAEEAKRIRKETEQRLVAMKEETAKKQREEEAKRLRALAEDPDIQRKYSALLQKGFMHFKSSPGGMQGRGDRPAPASLGDLSSRGWLRDVESFAKAMSRQPNPDYNVFNDRPTRADPRTPAEWQEMEQLLEQFKLLAPIWVEMGLLER